MTLTAALCLWGTALGEAQGAPPVEVIKNRIANFHKIGAAFKAIRDQLRTGEPAAREIQQCAGRIELLGSQIPAWFPPGTGAAAELDQRGDSRRDFLTKSDSGEDRTRARSEIWTERSAFDAAYRRFLVEAKKMTEAAKSGDKVAMTAQFKALGTACRNCHNTFRD